MDKKKVKVVEYSNHPEMEGDELKVTIMNNEKIKPRMRSKLKPRKLKQPRMTVAQLAVIVGQQGTKLDQLAITVNQLAVTVNSLALEMRAGFARVNTEIAAVNQKIDKIEDVLKRNNLK